jgi:sugar lactone lactonase YvrE
LVLKYDLATKRFAGIDTEGIVPEGLDIASGALWVVCDTFLRIDPATGEIAARIEPDTQGDVVAAGEDAVWFGGTQENVAAVIGGGRVWRVDPGTSAIVATIDLDTVIADLAAGAGGVWVLGLEDDVVRRIDPATNGISEVFRVGRIPEALGVGAESVWVTSSRDGTVTRFDPATADLKTIDVGGAAHEIVVGNDSVWVAVDAE